MAFLVDVYKEQGVEASRVGEGGSLGIPTSEDPGWRVLVGSSHRLISAEPYDLI